ncbi:MAG TPA: hypothetical protein DEB06_05375 [Phycisphaerales bacterium]|nr:hypothetical protein [Phycisphaerales bacterium]
MTNPDPFALLGMPRGFEMDRAALHRAWLARAARVHPDRDAGDPEREAALAALNLARVTLDDPERRAEALLRLMGGPTREADRTLPDGFLPEMLAVREEMESDLASDAAAARSKWGGWASARREEHIAHAAGLFREAQSGRAGALMEIRALLNAWRYVERMIERLG